MALGAEPKALGQNPTRMTRLSKLTRLSAGLDQCDQNGPGQIRHGARC